LRLSKLTAIEDREIERVIRKQEAIGLQSVTDGEFRRSWSCVGPSREIGCRKIVGVAARYMSENHPASALALPSFRFEYRQGRNRKPRWMGLAMNNDTNRPDDPDPDDLDGLAASLDYLRLWCESDGTGDSSAG
jgi:hypothetical protein